MLLPRCIVVALILWCAWGALGNIGFLLKPEPSGAVLALASDDELSVEPFMHEFSESALRKGSWEFAGLPFRFQVEEHSQLDDKKFLDLCQGASESQRLPLSDSDAESLLRITQFATEHVELSGGIEHIKFAHDRFCIDIVLQQHGTNTYFIAGNISQQDEASRTWRSYRVVRAGNGEASLKMFPTLPGIQQIATRYSDDNRPLFGLALVQPHASQAGDWVIDKTDEDDGTHRFGDGVGKFEGIRYFDKSDASLENGGHRLVIAVTGT